LFSSWRRDSIFEEVRARIEAVIFVQAGSLRFLNGVNPFPGSGQSFSADSEDVFMRARAYPVVLRIRSTTETTGRPKGVVDLSRRGRLVPISAMPTFVVNETVHRGALREGKFVGVPHWFDEAQMSRLPLRGGSAVSSIAITPGHVGKIGVPTKVVEEWL
jgi:hypothetical protein